MPCLIPYRRGIALFLLLLALAACRPAPAPAPDQPIPLPPAPTIQPGEIVTLLPRDSIRAIDDPQFEPAGAPDSGLRADERVLGLVINGDSRAYPLAILSVHEIVNDVVGGEPVAVTWCPLCYTGLVFSRRLPGREEPLTFAVSGKLLHNTLVMVDRESETLWSQLYGAALEGALAPAGLSLYASANTEWAAWLAAHPDGLVLSKRLTCAQFNCGTYADNPRGSYLVDPYASYYAMPDEGVINHNIPRETSREPKKRVLGVRLGAAARAYPLAALAEASPLNDELAGFPLLVWYDPATETAVAYGRRAGDQLLTFAPGPGPGLLVDRETGSEWRAATGQAVNGRLQGARLPPVAATLAFEFGWYGYFPHSDTFAN